MNEQLKNTKFCTNCGAKIDVKAEVCPKCGVRQPSIYSPPKDPGVAAVLSFFFMGLGQIYNGQIIKGVFCIILYALSIISMFIGIGFITTPILWVCGMIDAYQIAKRINTRRIQG